MSYVFLILSVLGIGVYFSIMNAFQRNTKQGIIISFCFSGCYALISMLVVSIIMLFNFQFTWLAVLLSGLNAICFLITTVIGIKVLSLGSIALYTVFMMLGGMIVPFFCGILLFNEPYNVWNFIAVALMTVALFLTVDDAKIEGGKKNVFKFFLFSFLVFLANGGTAVFATIHQKPQYSHLAVSSYQFAWNEYFFTFLFSAIILAINLVKKKREVKENLSIVVSKKNVLYPIFYACIHAFSNIMLLLALSGLPSSVQFPVITGGTIFLTTILGKFLFKDKTTLKTWIGVAIIVLATILFVI